MQLKLDGLEKKGFRKRGRPCGSECQQKGKEGEKGALSGLDGQDERWDVLIRSEGRGGEKKKSKGKKPAEVGTDRAAVKKGSKKGGGEKIRIDRPRGTDNERDS